MTYCDKNIKPLEILDLISVDPLLGSLKSYLKYQVSNHTPRSEWCSLHKTSGPWSNLKANKVSEKTNLEEAIKEYRWRMV